MAPEMAGYVEEIGDPDDTEELYEGAEDPEAAILDATFDQVSSITHPDLEGFDLEFESPPVTPEREARRAKVILAWEEYLSFLTQPQFTGQWIRLFTFTSDQAKDRAKARSRSIKSRLLKTQPTQLWEIRADADAEDPSMWKVFAKYIGPASEEIVQKRAADHQAAVERGLNAAKARSDAAQRRAAANSQQSPSKVNHPLSESVTN